MKNILHKLGEKLILIGYVKDDPVKVRIHQLQVENQQLRQEVSSLSIKNTILKCKLVMFRI